MNRWVDKKKKKEDWVIINVISIRLYKGNNFLNSYLVFRDVDCSNIFKMW